MSEILCNKKKSGWIFFFWSFVLIGMGFILPVWGMHEAHDTPLFLDESSHSQDRGSPHQSETGVRCESITECATHMQEVLNRIKKITENLPQYIAEIHQAQQQGEKLKAKMQEDIVQDQFESIDRLIDEYQIFDKMQQDYRRSQSTSADMTEIKKIDAIRNEMTSVLRQIGIEEFGNPLPPRPIGQEGSDFSVQSAHSASGNSIVHHGSVSSPPSSVGGGGLPFTDSFPHQPSAFQEHTFRPGWDPAWGPPPIPLKQHGSAGFIPLSELVPGLQKEDDKGNKQQMIFQSLSLSKAEPFEFLPYLEHPERFGLQNLSPEHEKWIKKCFNSDAKLSPLEGEKLRIQIGEAARGLYAYLQKQEFPSELQNKKTELMDQLGHYLDDLVHAQTPDEMKKYYQFQNNLLAHLGVTHANLAEKGVLHGAALWVDDTYNNYLKPEQKAFQAKIDKSAFQEAMLYNQKAYEKKERDGKRTVEGCLLAAGADLNFASKSHLGKKMIDAFHIQDFIKEYFNKPEYCMVSKMQLPDNEDAVKNLRENTEQSKKFRKNVLDEIEKDYHQYLQRELLYLSFCSSGKQDLPPELKAPENFQIIQKVWMGCTQTRWKGGKDVQHIENVCREDKRCETLEFETAKSFTNLTESVGWCNGTQPMNAEDFRKYLPPNESKESSNTFLPLPPHCTTPTILPKEIATVRNELGIDNLDGVTLTDSEGRGHTGSEANGPVPVSKRDGAKTHFRKMRHQMGEAAVRVQKGFGEMADWVHPKKQDNAMHYKTSGEVVENPLVRPTLHRPIDDGF